MDYCECVMVKCVKDQASGGRASKKASMSSQMDLRQFLSEGVTR